MEDGFLIQVDQSQVFEDIRLLESQRLATADTLITEFGQQCSSCQDILVSQQPAWFVQLNRQTQFLVGDRACVR